MNEPNDIYLRQASNIKQVRKGMRESRDNARSKTELHKDKLELVFSERKAMIAIHENSNKGS